MSAFKGVWAELVEFNDTFFPGWRDIDEVYYSNALAGETGELCNKIKKRAGGGTSGNGASMDEVTEELADIFIYLSLMAEKCGLDADGFTARIKEKMATNRARLECQGVQV